MARKQVPPNVNDYLEYIDDLVAKIAAALHPAGPLSRAIAQLSDDPRDPAREETVEFIRTNVTAALLISTRVLADFLEEYKIQGSDMAASDFPGAVSRSGLLSQMDRDRINKEVAHLSYERAPAQKPPEPFPRELMVRVLEGAAAFYGMIGRSPPSIATRVLGREPKSR
jgi:hypothetical protein